MVDNFINKESFSIIYTRTSQIMKIDPQQKSKSKTQKKEIIEFLSPIIPESVQDFFNWSSNMKQNMRIFV